MLWVAGTVLAVAIIAGCARIWLTLAFPASARLVYRRVAGRPLAMHVFEPKEAGQGPLQAARPVQAARPRPAIVFFFGGAWTLGTAAQFFPFCRYFAARGFVAFSAEYRIRLLHGTGITDALADARAAVQWVCEHAADYRIDSSRIVLSGGSSGGHLAAAVAMIPSGCAPAPPIAALVLFNPVTDLGIHNASSAWRLIARFLFKQDRDLSPVRHITPSTPPTLIFHGDADGLVPLAQSERFCDLMQRHRNVCDLEIYSGRGHAFFNYGLGYFEEIGMVTMRFLRRLGFTS